MEIALASWFVLSILAGVIASQKGRSGPGFFLLSLLLSPLVGIIAALVAGQNTSRVEARKLSSHEYKRCPYCAELIKREATVCRYCGKEVHVTSFSSETSLQMLAPTQQETAFCTHCGIALRANANFCVNCGTRVPGRPSD